MDNQTPQQTSPTTSPPVQTSTVQSAPSATPPPSKSFLPGKIVLLIVILLLILGGSGAYLVLNSQNKPAPTVSKITPTSAPTPTLTESLNPNTGNLYEDIKVRMNQVLK